MYECEIIEMKDSNFNHTVHHYDLELMELIEYSQEHDAMLVHAEYCGEVYWDEH